jgi:hypothetical protein
MKQYMQEVISEVQKHKTDNGNTETLEACKILNQESFMRIDHNWTGVRSVIQLVGGFDHAVSR